MRPHLIWNKLIGILTKKDGSFKKFKPGVQVSEVETRIIIGFYYYIKFFITSYIALVVIRKSR